ncbi:unnamed protein product [Peniophora sp. CBMAI 1063]|nr:unnamed protein product [Peniophora sp. CBMAI 1063]
MSGPTSFGGTSSGPALDAQFNAADAELILRSSDGVDLAAHMFVLRMSSPVFHDMLSLPQPSEHDDKTAGGQTVIAMAEDAQSLRLMLRFCYPRTLCPEPDLLTIADIKRAATLAQKYDVGLMHDAVEKALLRCAEGRPDIAYAVAWRYEYGKVLRAAARRTLEPFIADTDAMEWEEIPASSVFKLLRYQNSVPEALEGILRAEYKLGPRSQSVPMSWMDPDLLRSGDYYSIPANCTCETLLLYYDAQGEQKPDTTPTHKERPLRLVWEWWWMFVQSVVNTMMRSDRPFFEVAVARAVPDACAKARECPRCKLRDVQGLLEFTKTRLHAEIERRLAQIPLAAPFM